MNLVTLWRRGLTGLRGAGALALVAATAGIAALLAAAPVSAQPQDEWRDRGEVSRDTREMRVDRAQRFADRMDVRRLQRLVLMLDRAQVARDWREERRVRSRIHAVLRREMYEARRDLAQDQREEGRSREELRRDDMEGRGRPQVQDDWRDLRDDRRDTAESRARVMRQIEIMRRLRQIQPEVARGNRRALHDEDRLLESFLRLAREDARGDRREWSEDRNERREDVRSREEERQREERQDGEKKDRDEKQDSHDSDAPDDHWN